MVPCLSLVACSLPGAPDLDASAASSATAPASAALPAAIDVSPPIELVDLLYRTSARVAVSSTVSNHGDFPEHLVDHRPETAWNGKTGDLDARIELRVPESARIKRLSLTVGYDKITKEGDLFTMNHRVAQVAIEREGELIGTFDLDPESRAPQAIELDQPGGLFTVRATKTVPGSRASYREIVISELAVLGTAPEEELLLPAMPQVTVGSIDNPSSPTGRYEALITGTPYPTSAAYCARELGVFRKDLASLKTKSPLDWRLDELQEGCSSTRVRSKKIALAAPFTGVELLSAAEGQTDVTRLAVKTERGWYPTHVITGVNYLGPGCGLAGAQDIDSVEMRGARTIVVSLTTHSAYCMAGGTGTYDDAATFVVACTLGEGDALTCRQELVASYVGDCSSYYRAQETRHFDAQPPKWDWKREALVEPDGAIRLLPCLDAAGGATACTRRTADLLTR